MGVPCEQHGDCTGLRLHRVPLNGMTSLGVGNRFCWFDSNLPYPLPSENTQKDKQGTTPTIEKKHRGNSRDNIAYREKIDSLQYKGG